MKPKKITKEIKINELIEQYPESVEILMAYGLNCVGCVFSGHDTLKMGADVHGLSEEDIDFIVEDINSLIEENK